MHLPLFVCWYFLKELPSVLNIKLCFPPSILPCRSGDHMGRWQFRGGCGCSPPAWTPLWSLRQLQRPQAWRHHGRWRAVQVWCGRVCRVVAGRGKWSLHSAASSSPADIHPVPWQCQSQVPRPQGVPEDKIMGVSEVPPCGWLRPFLQVRGQSLTASACCDNNAHTVHVCVYNCYFI